MNYPGKVAHWINNQDFISDKSDYLEKYDPATGEAIGRVAKGTQAVAEKALSSAVTTFDSWSAVSVYERAQLLRKAVHLIEDRRKELAELIALEAGKSVKDSKGEVSAAIEMGYFVAGEGSRFYGRTTTSGVANRTAFLVRQPVGVAALITPANNPFAALAWKVFPALLCGNTVVVKASENTPYTSILFGQILKEAGLLSGVYSAVQGLGEEVGSAIVRDNRVDLISFTGSVATGRFIQTTAGERLAKVCLELGGKNALVICDDADLEFAVESAVLSAFSSAGQRCAAGSRIIVFESIYDKFKDLLLEKTKNLSLGTGDEDDLGPVISQRQLDNMEKMVTEAVVRGAKLIFGGHRLTGGKYKQGYYFEPTILEDVPAADEISIQELFGPVIILYRAKNLAEAIDLANNSPFGLTSAIHTQSLHRSEVFQKQIRAGIVSVNGNTYGSEPHLPFGGLKQSGNGWREAGTEALDVYSDWKTVYIRHNPERI